MSKEKLVISVITQDRPGIVSELSNLVNSSHCNIEDSRMMVLGGAFAILMSVSGKQSDIEALKSNESVLSEQFGSMVQMQMTADRELKEQGRPYLIEVVSLDHPGIVRELSEFVASRAINIEALDTEAYAAAHTGSPMFRLEMTVNIPETIKLAYFKQELSDFCDEQNLDVTVEAC